MDFQYAIFDMDGTLLDSLIGTGLLWTIWQSLGRWVRRI